MLKEPCLNLAWTELVLVHGESGKRGLPSAAWGALVESGLSRQTWQDSQGKIDLASLKHGLLSTGERTMAGMATGALTFTAGGALFNRLQGSPMAR